MTDDIDFWTAMGRLHANIETIRLNALADSGRYGIVIYKAVLDSYARELDEYRLRITDPANFPTSPSTDP